MKQPPQYKQQLFRLLIALVVLWLLLSGMFYPLQITLGIISILIVVYISTRMNVLTHLGEPLHIRLFFVIKYCIWLIGQILLSNLDVVKRILNPSLPIKPLLKEIPANQQTELGRVIYANSITLTPGTVAINIANNGNILIHALHEDAIFELEKGAMARRVNELEPKLKLTQEDNK